MRTRGFVVLIAFAVIMLLSSIGFFNLGDVKNGLIFLGITIFWLAAAIIRMIKSKKK